VTHPLEICLESPQANFHMGVHISQNFPELVCPLGGVIEKILLWRKN
jgi:hypothetical protein